MNINLRNVTPEDEPFEIALFDITWDELLSAMQISQEERVAMAAFQVRAQRASYANDYPDAITYIIEADGLPIGRYIFADRGNEILFIDIAIVPGYRSHGIGSLVISPQLERIRQHGATGYLRVRKDNHRAKALYERTGFVVIDEEEINYRMALKGSAREQEPTTA
jgi:ribosomal protein S18 acetylase RimI-like enzyme